jgi:hypothetical protein
MLEKEEKQKILIFSFEMVLKILNELKKSEVLKLTIFCFVLKAIK